jgi:hypothetical protein
MRPRKPLLTILEVYFIMLALVGVIVFFLAPVPAHGEGYVYPEVPKGPPYYQPTEEQVRLALQLAFGADEGSPNIPTWKVPLTRFEGLVEINVRGASEAELAMVKLAAFRLSHLAYPTACFVVRDNPSAEIQVIFGSLEFGQRFVKHQMAPTTVGVTRVRFTPYFRTGAMVFIKSGADMSTVTHELGHAVAVGGDAFWNKDGVWRDAENVPEFLSPTEQLVVMALYHVVDGATDATGFTRALFHVPQALFDSRVLLASDGYRRR